MDVRKVFFSLLILLGVSVNLLPTLYFYLNVYSSQKKSPYDEGAYMDYYLKFDCSGEKLVVTPRTEGRLRIQVVNDTCLRYMLEASVEVLYRNNLTTRTITVSSTGCMPRNSTFAGILLRNTKEGLFLRAPVTGRSIEVNPVPVNSVSFGLLAHPSYVLFPVAFSSPSAEPLQLGCATELNSVSYLLLENGDALLSYLMHMLSLQGDKCEYNAFEDRLFAEFFQLVLKDEPGIRELASKGVSYARVIVSLYYSNVRFSNNVPARVLFDFTFTFFPFNFVMIVAGVLGLIITRRRRIR